MIGSSERAPDRAVSLDAIRATACVMVIACHVSLYYADGALAGFKNGVMLFFALSGYLLYRPFVAGDVDLRRYAVQRLVRIVPAYIVALVGITLLTGHHVFLDQPLTYLLFLQNYDVRLWQGFLGVAWTLVIEVLFYITLPVLALVVRRSPVRLAAIASWSFAGACAAYMLVPTHDPRFIGSLFPFMVWTFVPGMLVALKQGRMQRAAHPSMLILGIVLLLVGTQSPWASVDLPSAVGSFFVVAWAVERRPSLGKAAVPASLGAALTYSAYLWHLDLLSASPSRPVALLAIVVVSGLAYLLVERPFIRLGRLFTRPKPREPVLGADLPDAPAVVSRANA